jgi:hypothetical protein
MLVILCILWVGNMAHACRATNPIWALNAFTALIITVTVAEHFPL